MFVKFFNFVKFFSKDMTCVCEVFEFCELFQETCIGLGS